MPADLDRIAHLTNTRKAALSLREAGFESFEDLTRIAPSSEHIYKAIFILGMSEKKKFVPFLSRFADGAGALSFEAVRLQISEN